MENSLVTANPHTATNLTILVLYEPVSNPLKSVKLLAVINCLVFCWVKSPLHERVITWLEATRYSELVFPILQNIKILH